ncbi:hypothetical protein PHJA_001808600 [Phtheirospermum japonicum]|uniref:General transcription and DNA repair factor IIH subunit TFB5 n=1 Tax=Phtheirospermum japonicum TaxID=374723 RepID=A0A830CNM0_9LAMI|nr:hypothetical protein PHJA_001808600 [Phtheirospermum japonicum]
MAQFIIIMNASFHQSRKFIIHVLDNTHISVHLDMAGYDQKWNCCIQRAKHMRSPLNSD